MHIRDHGLLVVTKPYSPKLREESGAMVREPMPMSAARSTPRESKGKHICNSHQTLIDLANVSGLWIDAKKSIAVSTFKNI